MPAINESRREFLKIAGYAAPVILTLSAMPAYAQGGSGIQEDSLRGNNVLGNFEDPAPPGIAKRGLPQNDVLHGNNGLGNGVDPAPPGIAKQGRPQNDE